MSDRSSSPGQLAGCLIESDTNAIQRARRLRRKALAISLVLEAIVLAALLAWPLLYPSTLSATYTATPVPPYRHGVEEKPQTPARPMSHRPLPTPVLTQPAVIPPHVITSPLPAPLIEPNAASTGDAIPMGDILGIDGGSNYGPPLGPPRPPGPPERHATPHQMSEGVMEAMLIRRVQPMYPAAALAMRISGTVRLRAIISTDGRVLELNLLSGNPVLARAAMTAVSEWRYRPTLLNGQAVEVETLITVNFVLE